MRAKCCNFAKSAAVFKKHEPVRFSMSVIGRLTSAVAVDHDAAVAITSVREKFAMKIIAFEEHFKLPTIHRANGTGTV
jgi:hypothetical protein